MADFSDKRGVYNIDYFAGSQCAVFIGDVLVDEITSMSYAVHQTRTPIYGYADTLFRDISKGPVLVQGTFTINFKEAGYLWLILNRYRSVMKGETTFLSEVGKDTPLGLTRKRQFYDNDSHYLNSLTIEQMVNGETSAFQRTKVAQQLAALAPVSKSGLRDFRTNTQKELLGFSSRDRAGLSGDSLGAAESIFEAFENQVWINDGSNSAVQQHRRADDPALNNFDIFVTFGDYTGSDHENHTVQKITNVVILGTSKQIVIDGQPIQEAYQFIGRNII